MDKALGHSIACTEKGVIQDYVWVSCRVTLTFVTEGSLEPWEAVTLARDMVARSNAVDTLGTGLAAAVAIVAW